MTEQSNIEVSQDGASNQMDEGFIRQSKARAARLGHDARYLSLLGTSLAESLSDLASPPARVLVIGEEQDAIKNAFKDTLAFSTELKFCGFYPELLSPRDTLLPLSPKQWSADMLLFDGKLPPTAIAIGGTLHSYNDPALLLSACGHLLGEDCPVIGSFFGEKSLSGLSEKLIKREMELHGRVSLRVLPMIDMRSLAGLLQGAGLTLAVLERESISIDFPNLYAAALSLRAAGEANSYGKRARNFAPRNLFSTSTASATADTTGTTAGTTAGTAAGKTDKFSLDLEVIHFVAWSKSDKQPKALRPGSAKLSLKDALK